MLTALVAITRNTFMESIRQPIFVVVLLIGSALLVFNPLFSAYTLEDDNLLMLDLGLSTLLLAGLFLGAFTATSVVSREIESHTALTVLSKPLSRSMFLAGKFAGVVLSVALAEWVWTQVFLLTIRHGVMMRATDQADVPVLLFGLGGFFGSLGYALWRNYRRRRPFGSTLALTLALVMPCAVLAAFCFDKEWRPQSPLHELNAQVLLALLLLFEAVAILCALAIAVSTRFGQAANLIACAAFFLLGLTSDYFLGSAGEGNWQTGIAHVLIPNFQYLWLSDALLQGNPVSLVYVAATSIYSVLIIAGMLAVATALFETRELS